MILLDESKAETPGLDALARRQDQGRGLAALATLAGGHPEPRPLYRELPEPEPYPVEALGPSLGEAAKAIHEQIQAPLALCAQSVLGAAALAVQGFADIELPMGLIRPCSLYMVTIAPSGERKSSADELALAPIRLRERDLASAYAQDLEEYRDLADAWDKQRQQLLGQKNEMEEKQRALKWLGGRPEAPLIHLLTCPEPTFEGLTRLFAEGQPALGLFSAEGGQFLGGFAMTKDQRQKTAAAMNSLWDGDPIRRVRAGDGSHELPGRRLSVHLLVQPQAAQTLLADPLLADIGLLSRILVAAPTPAAGSRTWREPDASCEEALRRYQRQLEAILGRQLPLAEGARNVLQPRPLSLSPLARQLWIRFADSVEAELGGDGKLAPIRAFANKLPEHATRLAAVLALVEEIGVSQLSEEHLARGIQMADFYAGEALRLFETGATDPDLLLAQRVLDWLHGAWPEGKVSLPDIYQRGPKAVRDLKTAKKVVHILAEHGWLVPVEGGAEIAGVRRRKVWEIVGR